MQQLARNYEEVFSELGVAAPPPGSRRSSSTPSSAAAGIVKKGRVGLGKQGVRRWILGEFICSVNMLVRSH